MKEENKKDLMDHLDLYKSAIEDGDITKIAIVYMDKNDEIGATFAGFKKRHELVGLVHVGLDCMLEIAKKADSEDAGKRDPMIKEK